MCWRAWHIVPPDCMLCTLPASLHLLVSLHIIVSRVEVGTLTVCRDCRLSVEGDVLSIKVENKTKTESPPAAAAPDDYVDAAMTSDDGEPGPSAAGADGTGADGADANGSDDVKCAFLALILWSFTCCCSAALAQHARL